MTMCEVRCSYCKSLLGHKEIDLPEGMPAVTYGICQACFDIYIAPEFSEGTRRLEAYISNQIKALRVRAVDAGADADELEVIDILAELLDARHQGEAAP